jgi:competence protein ComEA
VSARIRGAASRLAARLGASRFAKPAARVTLVAAGLACLAAIGRVAVAGSAGSPADGTSPASPGRGRDLVAVPAVLASASSGPYGPSPASPERGRNLDGTSPAAGHPPASSAPGGSPVPASSASSLESPIPPRGRASPDDPVVLNSAGVDDLRRLPGIGEKRANAILALRARLGRLRAVEDLLKVKGIGRAMLKRLRPLVRIDPRSLPDAGATEVEH